MPLYFRLAKRHEFHQMLLKNFLWCSGIFRLNVPNSHRDTRSQTDKKFGAWPTTDFFQCLTRCQQHHSVTVSSVGRSVNSTTLWLYPVSAAVPTAPHCDCIQCRPQCQQHHTVTASSVGRSAKSTTLWLYPVSAAVPTAPHSQVTTEQAGAKMKIINLNHMPFQTDTFYDMHSLHTIDTKKMCVDKILWRDRLRFRNNYIIGLIIAK